VTSGKCFLDRVLLICVGAEAARYLTSGLAQAHRVTLILDILSRKVLK